MNLATKDSTKSLIHLHLALNNLNFYDIQRLYKESMTTDMQQPTGSQYPCESCIIGKHKHTPFPDKSFSKTTEIGQLIHHDICGPIEISSLGGYRYFYLFIDDYSRYSVIYFSNRKCDVLNAFIKFDKVIFNKTGKHAQKYT